MSNDSFDSLEDDDLVEILERPVSDNVERLLKEQEDAIVAQKPGKVQRTLYGDSLVVEPSEKYAYEEIVAPIKFNSNNHNLNRENLSTFVYPTNMEFRDYQFDIVSKALFSNVLCALPTGLGKTFIASTVMLNFYRWTTDSKIVFMAPTRPLVAQQVIACYGITGIPRSDTAILLDKVKKNRAEIWESKRVFFTTPQVVENDLASGFVNPKKIVCLVVDEAHRAKGNYAYAKVAEFIKRFSNSFRVLALTATPSSDIEGVQKIIDTLMISKVAVRTENSIDIIKYMKRRKVEKIQCDPTPEMEMIVDMISEAILPVLKKANEAHIYEVTDPSKINAFTAMEASTRVINNPRLAEGIKWTYYFQLQLLGTVGQCFRRLNIYGVNSFMAYFNEKFEEFTTKWEAGKSKNRIAHSFYYNPLIKSMIKYVEGLVAKDNELADEGKVFRGVFSHPKMERLVEEMNMFFDDSPTSNSKVIVFVEFRDVALELVRVLENTNTRGRIKLRPHIFIGQAAEKDKFDKKKFLSKNKKKKKKKKNEEEEEEDEDEEEAVEEDSRPRTRVSDRLGSSENAQLKGMNQKQQRELIKKFKDGTYNILVATSIGEEGLDIGEVDMIVCFDSTSSPIKNIQRMGRTGRKRDGKVLLLYSSNEREKFERAMDNYEWIQKQIQQGKGITLRASDRIVPKDIQPRADKRPIEIPDENDELIHEVDEDDSDAILRLATQAPKKGKGKTNTKAAPKRKKQFFLPDGAETGFKSAASMVKRVKVSQEDEESARSANTTHETSVLDDLIGPEEDEHDSDDDILEFLRQDFLQPSSSPHKADLKDQGPRETQPITEEPEVIDLLSQTQSKTEAEEDVVPSQFGERDGYLTSEQRDEFYKKHWSNSQPDLESLANPSVSMSGAFIYGKVGHSKRTKSFVNTMYRISSMDEKTAHEMKLKADTIDGSSIACDVISKNVYN